MTAYISLLVIALTQLLGACYNYQYLNAIGIDPGIHPLTLEDNLQTALTQLPTFASTILFPLVLGFTFTFLMPKTKKLAEISLEIDSKKEAKISVKELTHFSLKLLVTLTLCAISFCFFEKKQAIFISQNIVFAFLIFVTMSRITKFSFSDVASILACVLFCGFLAVTSIQNGDAKGTADKKKIGAQYLIKLKNDSSKEIACSAIRVYANDVLLLRDGKTVFIKLDLIQEIHAL